MVVAASIVARLIAGKASRSTWACGADDGGRRVVGGGHDVVLQCHVRPVLLTAGVVYGLSIGINMPAIFAWTVDLAPEGKAATSLSTMLMALEVGIGGGAYVSGTWYATNPESCCRCTAVVPFLDWRGLPFCSGGGAFTKRRFRPLITPVSCAPFRDLQRYLVGHGDVARKTVAGGFDRTQSGHGRILAIEGRAWRAPNNATTT